MKDKIRLGDLLRVEAKQSASRRTKNRIRENGDHFIFMKESNSVSLFGGGTAFLLRAITENASNGKGGKENWLGWLPANEVLVSDAELLPETEEVTLVKV
ncbi:hypothetical protein [Alteromonas sp.]|uniref:hypothetical protein n=1 Tax=Alteromonas sp. TaxID=232 RepID=UPI000C6B2FD8|nr:hypothetical protein [Alteromonas sp.]MAI39217.1 hypothetical protein [Alteromonas sp.]